MSNAGRAGRVIARGSPPSVDWNQIDACGIAALHRGGRDPQATYRPSGDQVMRDVMSEFGSVRPWKSGHPRIGPTQRRHYMYARAVAGSAGNAMRRPSGDQLGA